MKSPFASIARGARISILSTLGICSFATLGCSASGDLGAAGSTVDAPKAAAPRAPSREPAPFRDHAQHRARSHATGATPSARAAGVAPAPRDADADRGYDVLRYDVRGAFNWTTSSLRATVGILVKLTAPDATRLVLDCRVSQIFGVTSNGTTLPYELDATTGLLTVDLTPLGTQHHGAGALHLSIAYETSTSEGLHVEAGLDGDPTVARVVFTDSEPVLGSLWLPGNHRPSDRARFSIELEMDASHDLVANGRRVSDVVTAPGRHKVAYATDVAIPTYIMAFALGDLVHEDSDRGCAAPLAIWHRRGVAVDSRKHLALLRRLMTTYEGLLGPYPFESYAVVLLPNYPGGMENATITFNQEPSGQGTIDVNINAHELAHSWFGDYVTVRTWDDLWIKEGLATLLAYEAARAEMDRRDRGRLFGDAFTWLPGDAIRDRSLGEGDGLDRYTTGPYERGAWLLTQIRSLVGDPAFFRALRAVLATHALGSVSSDELLAAFAPYLDGRTLAKASASLDQYDGPHVSVVEAPDTPNALRWTVDDPANVLLAPIDIASIDAAGRATTYHLSAEANVTTPLAAGGYLAPDERDVQPDLQWALDLDADAYASLVAPHLAPTADGALRAFETRSAAHQEAALTNGAFPWTSATFPRADRRLGSTAAQGLALGAACAAMQTAGDPAAMGLWFDVLLPIVRRTPDYATFSGDAELPACGIALPTRAFGAELARLTADTTGASSQRLDYVMSFDFGAKATFDTFAPVANGSNDGFLRTRAFIRLSRQPDPTSGFSPVDAQEAPRWKAFFRERMQAATTPFVLRTANRGSLGLKDADVLPILAQKLRAIPGIRPSLAVQMVCGGYAIAAANGIAPTAFQTALQPSSTFPSAVAAVIDDPTRCP